MSRGLDISGRGVTVGGRGVHVVPPITVVDRFEDADISEYSGDTGGFSVQGTTVLEGSQTLESSLGASGGQRIISTSGLNAYPAQGDTYKTALQLSDTDDRIYPLFGVQDIDSYYQIAINAEQDQFDIWINQNGSYTELQAGTASVSSHLNESLTCTVKWATDGTINAILDAADGTELGNISTTDTTFTSGGIGWRHYNGVTTSTVYYDNARIV